MHFLTYYNNNVVKYDLINKFICKNSATLPKLSFISLRFNFNSHDLKQLFSGLFALELIAGQKSTFIKSNSFNLNLKIKKGYPIGCKVVLRNLKMQQFLVKLFNKILTTNKKYKISVKPNNSFSITIKNILIFSNLEKNYQFFKNLNSLNISIGVNTKNINFIKFLLNSYKIKT